MMNLKSTTKAMLSRCYISSTSKVKSNAVRAAFGNDIEYHDIACASGVSEQPMGSFESKCGLYNRHMSLKLDVYEQLRSHSIRSATILVSIENGAYVSNDESEIDDVVHIIVEFIDTRQFDNHGKMVYSEVIESNRSCGTFPREHVDDYLSRHKENKDLTLGLYLKKKDFRVNHKDWHASFHSISRQDTITALLKTMASGVRDIT